MTTPQQKQYEVIGSVNRNNQQQTLYIMVDDRGLPPKIGTGRSAVIFLVQSTNKKDDPSADRYAVKILRDDIDRRYAGFMAERFLLEIENVRDMVSGQATFVKFLSWGAIRVNGDEQAYWLQEPYLAPYMLSERQNRTDTAKSVSDIIEDIAGQVIAVNESDRLKTIMQHYKLQGLFYIMELCYGTLRDALDKDTPWFDLDACRFDLTMQRALKVRAGELTKDIDFIHTEFLKRHPVGRSGYDILNDFNNENLANQLRNFAVLELFGRVADTVAKFHNRFDFETGGYDHLTHRDLKPGNVFFEVRIAANGSIESVNIKLADPGYVADPDRLELGDLTQRVPSKSSEYLAPGSRFFWAPEQSEPPIEVKVNVDPSDRHVVTIRGSKIGEVEAHDWLEVADLFSEDTRKIKILEARYSPEDEQYTLRLKEAISGDEITDLQAQVIKATGFHSDGFSLGAMLYDLISGGKNPEEFYNYCIKVFTGHFVRDKKYENVDTIIDILYPQTDEQGDAISDRLGLEDRWSIINHVFGSKDVDELVERVLESSYLNTDPSRHRIGRRKKIVLVDTVVRSKRTYDLNTSILSLLPNIEGSKLGFIRKWRLVWQAIKANDIYDIIEKVILETTKDYKSGEPSSKRDEIRERIKNYRFRKFHVVSDLLMDKRGVLIPRDILAIIVKCMVRNIDGGYYNNDSSKGYLSQENIKASEKIGTVPQLP